MPTTTAQTSSGVVQAIDQLQRQDVGVGMLGAAAAGGMPSDKVYRITMRLDDGSTQVVVVESAPSVKIGDRIRYSNGAVQPY
jgi:outer membrane lipoprotein SlyB